MKGQQIYFTKDEIDSLCEFFNAFEGISPDEETYAYWLRRIGSAEYKLFSAKESKEIVNTIEEN